MAIAIFSKKISEPAIKKIEELISKPRTEIKIAFIFTAAKPYIKQDIKEVKIKQRKIRREIKIAIPDWLQEDIDLFNHQGFRLSLIDIEEYKSKIKLAKILDEFDAIYVSGGNLFYLMNAIESVDFDEIIDFFIQKRLYIGSSAGAVCLTKDINPYDILDSRGEIGAKIDIGIGVVDFHLLVHWENPKYQEKLTRIADYYKTRNYKIFFIKDTDSLFVNDGKIVKISSNT